MIKAVIFDVDGTLIDSFEANLRFFQDLMIRFGYKPPTGEEYAPLMHMSMRDVIPLLAGSMSEEDAMKIWEAGRGHEVLYHTELLHMRGGAEETIRKLYENYTLGIVTSRVKSSVFEFPRLAALRDLFSVAIAYEDTVNHKPHPDPLLLAASQLGVLSADAVYVGDADSDMKAARAAGMKAVLCSKEKSDLADAQMNAFRDLPHIIASLG